MIYHNNVFKARKENEVTSYLGCESYEIEKGVIRFNLPYSYIKGNKEWFRVHGGKGNVNGSCQVFV